MAGTFTLSITTNSSFGDSKASERQQLIRALEWVVQEIGSGRPSAHIFDPARSDIGSYVFGAGMLNAGA
jgi:hypothetical protein